MNEWKRTTYEKLMPCGLQQAAGDQGRDKDAELYGPRKSRNSFYPVVAVGEPTPWTP